jgi:hypothetical protein
VCAAFTAAAATKHLDEGPGFTAVQWPAVREAGMLCTESFTGSRAPLMSCSLQLEGGGFGDRGRFTLAAFPVGLGNGDGRESSRAA